MREMKFRAWDKRKQEMHYTDTDKTVWAGGKEVSVNTDEGQMPGDFISMQFTGFHDKKDKEIYESDCLKYGNRIFSVQWFGDGWNYTTIKGYFMQSPRLLDLVVQAEIIGNVYENPELLKGA